MTATAFAPIAVIGYDCVVPGALNPRELWRACVQGLDLTSTVDPGLWSDYSEAAKARVSSARGGYIKGFEALWRADGFAVPPETLSGLDPLVHWVLHCARGALIHAGVKPFWQAQSSQRAPRIGAIFGNLGFPSPAMVHYACAVWRTHLHHTPPEAGLEPRNRFMSGGSAAMLQAALKLNAGAFCLDAACASSLYAIKLACTQLQLGRAEIMLAGAVQGADDLFLHQGFSALGALSPSGQSRPFNGAADGLLPAQGCAFVALKTLAQARADGDHIFGVIRGIGLSNDGRGKGLLVPDARGQQRAMRSALAQAQLPASAISLLECHATGTQLGDLTELQSTAAVYGERSEALPMASLKSNMGHLITAAGAAGLIKVLESMAAARLAPSLHSTPAAPELANLPLRVLTRAEDWDAKPKIAAVSAFGFGGNNAHIVVSEANTEIVEPSAAREEPRAVRLALVAQHCAIGPYGDTQAVSKAWFEGDLRRQTDLAMHEFSVELTGLRLPPKDLEQSLPQQIAIAQSARTLVTALQSAEEPRLANCFSGPRCGVFVGMEVDPEVARFGLRWQARSAKEVIVGELESAGVMGCMPNIPANRISALLDLQGPSFTVQAGSASGLWALQVAADALAAGELDGAVVGAVDFCCEPVNRAAVIDVERAAKAASGPAEHAADAVVVWALMRQDDAESLCPERIIATLAYAETGAAESEQERELDGAHLRACLGNTGAAEGLLHLSLASVELQHRRQSDGTPWLSAHPRAFRAPMPHGSLRVEEFQPEQLSASLTGCTAPALFECYLGDDRAALIESLTRGETCTPDSLRAPANRARARMVLCRGADGFHSAAQRALAHLRDGTPAGMNVHVRSSALEGGLAFAFAGAGASYAGMGRSLLNHFPQLHAPLRRLSSKLSTAMDWALTDVAAQPSALQQLWGASALSQLHALLSTHVLGMKPDAWIGYSSGETNALVASGIWRDPDALMQQMESTELIERYLGGPFEAVSAAWQMPVLWGSWTVLAPIAQVQAAISDLPYLHIAIINSANDCLIAGDRAQGEIALQRLQGAHYVALDYPLAVHVPELDRVRDLWLALHTRACHTIHSGRIYSSATGQAYPPSPRACAQAILAQANTTLDLRKVVTGAWDDGVRLFLEHGPGGTFARAIRNHLVESGRISHEDSESALVLSWDRKLGSVDGTVATAAALLAAGVHIDADALARLYAHHLPAEFAEAGPRLTLAAHWPLIRSTPMTDAPITEAVPTATPLCSATVVLTPAPALPNAAFSEALQSALPGEALLAEPTPTHHSERALFDSPVIQPIFPDVLNMPPTPTPDGTFPPLSLAPIYEAHQHFITLQARAQAQYMQWLSDSQNLLLCQLDRAGLVAHAVPEAVLAPALPAETRLATRQAIAPLTALTAGSLPGPRFSRAELEQHADGRISALFGSAFAAQDQFARQVRMPRPPLLLADRVVGLEAEPMSMGKGRIWTETDVQADAWYAHYGWMPPGVMIEAGQADLMLISYLGIDQHNRGERVYRLLGCELTYHGNLARSGDQLQFEIVLDSHAAQGDVRLMFFHYQCHNLQQDGTRRPQLSVRGGQAGFFTDQELADSAGCLWQAELQEIVANPRLDPPAVACEHQQLTNNQLHALAAGNAFGCFGSGFERAQTHTRTPNIGAGKMLLLDRVTELALRGGPWQRGYLRAELDIAPDLWFFDGHFKNDPCMPGTLMFDACLQAMAIYLASCGYTLTRDAWRFQPVPEQAYALMCRGQVIPSSKLLVTEVFVEEVIAGPIPTLYADLLCTVDGLKAFHARRVGLELVPDWPLDTRQNHSVDGLSAPLADGFRLDQQSVQACALGKPSAAFGPMYQRFDTHQRVARLPSPPYLFISRIVEVEGAIGVMQAGARVVADYDVPPSVWYFDENGHASMPFAVLLEVVLQPCGWLSSYVGSALTQDDELGFRNLDGEGTVLAEITPGDGFLRTAVTLTGVSASAGMIIENFQLSCLWHRNDGSIVECYRLSTVFGFFPPQALANQAGLPRDPAALELFQRPGNHAIALADAPAALFKKRARLAGTMLRMIDQIEGLWPDDGKAGLGQIRTRKDVDPAEWFFKAHFFQDPVQPGSLGLEAMLQTLQCLVLLRLPSNHSAQHWRFECLGLGQAHRWKYRGQVLPHHRQVHTTLELLELKEEPNSLFARAKASLWVDGQRIYEALDLSLRLRP